MSISNLTPALSHRSSLGLLFNPENAVASAFPNGGASAPDYNTGLTFYFIFWVRRPSIGPSSMSDTRLL
jgi:hypothetical protein